MQFFFIICFIQILGAIEHGVQPFSLSINGQYSELYDPVIDIDDGGPIFFQWTVPVNSAQTAFQLTVGSAASVTTTRWIKSDESYFNYTTEAGFLQPSYTYWASVKIRTASGLESLPSTQLRFLTVGNVSAAWADDCPWLQGGGRMKTEIPYSSLPTPSDVTVAHVWVAGLGYNVVWLNGRRAGGLETRLESGWTRTTKRILFSVYDVTEIVKSSSNSSCLSIGVELGGGHYANNWLEGKPNKLSLRMQLLVRTAAQRFRYTTGSSSSWLVTTGPRLQATVYGGETFDSRRSDWKTGPAWSPAVPDPSAGLLTGKMVARQFAPQQVLQRLPAQSMHLVEGSGGRTWVFDFGQVISGWTRIEQATDNVTLCHAELLFANGTVNQKNLGLARATDQFIVAPAPTASSSFRSWEPEFTYHGFRYVAVTYTSSMFTRPTIRSYTAAVVASAVQSNSRLQFTAGQGHRLLNQILNATKWSAKTNLHAIPTDCPNRDERLGWLADAHVSSDAQSSFWDMAAFYTHFVNVIQDSQNERGQIADFTPACDEEDGNPLILCDRSYLRPGDPSWSFAYIQIALLLYREYGLVHPLQVHKTHLQRYVDDLWSLSAATNHLIDFGDFGDWYAISPCATPLVSSFSFYQATELMAQVLDVLNGPGGAGQQYRRRLTVIAAAYNRRFFNASTHSYSLHPRTDFATATGRQSANALPLFAGIVDDSHQTGVCQTLVHVIREGARVHGQLKYADHVSTGVIGTRFILPTLSRVCGAGHLALRMVLQTTFPGWGFMIDSGATTLWEHWQNEYEPVDSSSHNHIMFGSVVSWIWSDLIGLTQCSCTDPPHGYRCISIEPDYHSLLSSQLSFSLSKVTRAGEIKIRFDSNASKVTVSAPSGAVCGAHVSVPDKVRLPHNSNSSGGRTRRSLMLNFCFSFAYLLCFAWAGSFLGGSRRWGEGWDNFVEYLNSIPCLGEYSNCLANKTIVTLGDSTMEETVHDMAAFFSLANSSRLREQEYERYLVHRSDTVHVGDRVTMTFYERGRDMMAEVPSLGLVIRHRFIGHYLYQGNRYGIKSLLHPNLQPFLNEWLPRADLVIVNSELHDQRTGYGNSKTDPVEFMQTVHNITSRCQRLGVPVMWKQSNTPMEYDPLIERNCTQYNVSFAAVIRFDDIRSVFQPLPLAHRPAFEHIGKNEFSGANLKQERTDPGHSLAFTHRVLETVFNHFGCPVEQVADVTKCPTLCMRDFWRFFLSFLHRCSDLNPQFQFLQNKTIAFLINDNSFSTSSALNSILIGSNWTHSMAPAVSDPDLKQWFPVFNLTVFHWSWGARIPLEHAALCDLVVIEPGSQRVNETAAAAAGVIARTDDIVALFNRLPHLRGEREGTAPWTPALGGPGPVCMTTTWLTSSRFSSSIGCWRRPSCSSQTD